MKQLLLAVALALAACQPAPGPHPTDHGVAGTTGGATVTAGAITIEGAVASPPPGGVTTGAAYMVIRNAADTPDRLIGVSSPQASPVELHTHRDVGGAMRMERVASVDVPAHGAVTFEPHGLHLMLFNYAPVGGETPVTLTFEKAGPVTVTFKVSGS